MCNVIFLSLFHWSTFLFWCHYNAIFVNIALYHNWKSGIIIPPTVFVCFAQDFSGNFGSVISFLSCCYDQKYLRGQLEKGKIYFGSQFQENQSMFVWSHVLRQTSWWWESVERSFLTHGGEEAERKTQEVTRVKITPSTLPQWPTSFG
jgi:hypothetical protein